MTSITEDELLAEIQAMLERADSENEAGTITTPEVIERFRVGRVRAKRLLTGLVDAGVLERGRVVRVDDWGTQTHVKGFRYVNGSKES